jgi:hypothetical protein
MRGGKQMKKSVYWFSLGICVLVAAMLLTLAPTMAEADVVAKGSWEIHQDEFVDGATDLHFTIYAPEPWIYIKSYTITVTLLDPCPLGSNFTSSSFSEHNDGQGDTLTHAIDCEFWDGAIPFCCYVRIDARLVLSGDNDAAIRDIVWTQDDDPVEDDLPDNGWRACKGYVFAPLAFTFYNDDDTPFDLIGLQFYTEGLGELSGDDLWAWSSWNYVPVPSDFFIEAGGSIRVYMPFEWGYWLYFRAEIVVGSDTLTVGGQHESNEPTYVELASLEAAGRGDFVEVTWATATEIDNASFNIRRGLSRDGDRVRINPEPIAARGDVLTGGTYTFRDYGVAENVTYYYWLEDVDLHGNVAQHGPVSARLRSLVSKPVKLFLDQNSPNPFSTATDIRFGLPTASAVRLTIHDLAGREVRTLVSGNEPAGYRTVHWDGLNDAGQDIAGGVYFCVLEAGNEKAMRKLIYMK